VGGKARKIINWPIHWLGIIFLLRHHPLSSLRALHIFRKSLGVGNSLYKISVRYREISKSIDKFMPNKFVALEFGSGSSTILLYQCPKVLRLISIEEFKEFLPLIKHKRKVWETPALHTDIIEYYEYQTKVFLDTVTHVKQADLIYIDGPSTPKSRKFNLSEPNLDLIPFEGLANKVILVDCRTLTVCEISRKLRKTHTIILSKAVLREYRNFLSGQKDFKFMEELIEKVPELANGSLGFHTIRTSIFIPNIRNFNNLFDA
jgi:hypothetical protein